MLTFENVSPTSFTLSEDGIVQLLFYWVPDDDAQGTHYNDVLRELRPRLEGMGFVADVENIQKQVTDNYGKGS